MTRLVSLFLVVSALAFSACASNGGGSPCDDPDGCPTRPDAAVGPRCGDNICQSTETATSCPADCHAPPGPVCGNGSCEAGETTSSCPADCPPAVVCGDGVCSASETIQSCAADCGATLVVDNTSSYTIYYFYAWACGQTNPYTNLLNGTLPPNYHITFTGVPPGCWNIQADTANHAQTASDSNLTLTAGHTFTWTLHN